MTRPVVLLTLVAVIALCTLARAESKHYALLVGVDKYPENSLLNSLAFPVRDVEGLQNVLLAAGYQRENVILMSLQRGVDKPRYLPTASNIQRELDLLVKLAKPEDTLLVALAGHGVLMKVRRTIEGNEIEREESLFCPLDADLKEKDLNTFVSVNMLYEKLDKCPASLKLLLSDACRDKPFAGGRPGGVINLRPVDPPQTVAALFSCQQGEIAMEDRDLDGGHGVFFHHVIQGLSGQADSSHDGKVTLLELSAYVTEEVPRYVARKYGISQTPELLTAKIYRIPLVEIQGVVTNSIGMKLVLIPAGEFLMGSPESEKDRYSDELQHRVRITRPFYLGQHEVTRGQFAEFVRDQGYKTEAERDGKGGYGFDGAKAAKGGYPWEKRPEFTWRNPGFPQTDDHPVVNVSWNDADAFCKWLSRKEGKTYRLPTEAEWEYACRAGTATAWYGGDAEDSLRGVANIADASLKAKYTGASWAKSWDDAYPFTSPMGRFQPNKFGLFDMHGNASEWCADW